MDIFLSWSGPRSEAIARALNKWLPLVLQSVKPWMSREIEKGSRWDDVISERLEKTDFGVVCLTPEALTSDWVLFEAGALSKKAREARVCTYLFDLKETDVTGPLAKFQHTRADKDDTRRLVATINNALGDVKLEAERLTQTFEQWWPELAQSLEEVVREVAENAAPKRNADDKLDEILLEVRDIRRASAAAMTYPLRAAAALGVTGLELERTIRPEAKAFPFTLEDREALTRYACRTHSLSPLFVEVLNGPPNVVMTCCEPFNREVVELAGIFEQKRTPPQSPEPSPAA